MWIAATASAQHAPQAAQPQQPSAQQPTFGATTQEVLLDVIIRDRKGRPVRDLTADEVEVLDAGSPVRVRSFRFIEGKGDERSPEAAPARRPGVEQPAFDPLRQIRLVTLVFDRLSVNGRRLFRQAALDLLGSAPEQNLYFSVFCIDQRLQVLQQFTADRGALERAVARALSGSYSQFASESAAIQTQLEASGAADAAAASSAASGRETQGGSGVGEAQSAAVLARMQLNSLLFSQSMSGTQESRNSIFALMGLVKEQSRLPGRKMLLYFSESFKIPESVQEHFHTLVSAANRANVSIYTVDARGLLTGSQHEESRTLLGAAASASQREVQRYRTQGTQAVSPDEVKMFDTVLDGLRSNIQASLNELAISTGGFLIADSNDLRTPLRRALDEIRSYYEIAYSPDIANYDGHFRTISVKVKRPDVIVQARSGYYALPPLSEAPLFPFEVPLLNALTRSPLPNAFDYRAGVQRFDPRGNEIQYAVTIEVPLAGLTFAVDKEKRLASVRASLLIFFKDAAGAIVAKMSRDFPYDAPLATLDGFRAGNLIQTYHVKLRPGRYTLETAVADRNAEAVSARRAVVIVSQPSKGLAMSHLVILRRTEPQPGDPDPAEPYQFEGGRAVPTLADTVDIRVTRDLPLFFAIYPDPAIKQAPALRLALLQDGKVLGQSPAALPKAASSGRIAYVATLPIAGLAAGQYEVRAIVQQGDSVTGDRLFFNVR